MWKHYNCKDILYEGKLISPTSILPGLSILEAALIIEASRTIWALWRLEACQPFAWHQQSSATRQKENKYPRYLHQILQNYPRISCLQPFRFSSNIQAIQWSQFIINDQFFSNSLIFQSIELFKHCISKNWPEEIHQRSPNFKASWSLKMVKRWKHYMAKKNLVHLK